MASINKYSRHELRTSLKDQGCLDVDLAMTLIEGAGGLKVTEHGDVEGVPDVVKGFRQAKAYLFPGDASTTPAAKAKSKSVLGLDRKAYEAERTAMRGGRVSAGDRWWGNRQTLDPDAPGSRWRDNSAPKDPEEYKRWHMSRRAWPTARPAAKAPEVKEAKSAHAMSSDEYEGALKNYLGHRRRARG
jgi:hypothetical protein